MDDPESPQPPPYDGPQGTRCKEKETLQRKTIAANKKVNATNKKVIAANKKVNAANNKVNAANKK